MTLKDEFQSGLKTGLRPFRAACGVLLPMFLGAAILMALGVALLMGTTDYAGHRPAWAQGLSEVLILLGALGLLLGSLRAWWVMFQVAFSQRPAKNSDTGLSKEEDPS
ncbi:protein of unknown function [Denitratisoma oestradiolicum]|uniref:Uncharacterized protein n=2 Tax=Denitratisoma oestradiolicum TaxID=311182 RepID=A0A6S6YKN2_9PROT|nr:hypothetical protein CBW56_18160 [Denitratisoma oestradiolicum]CAB1368294.1 protein of unknown function [Denitratisoma oestradiolicum]